MGRGAYDMLLETIHDTSLEAKVFKEDNLSELVVHFSCHLQTPELCCALQISHKISVDWLCLLIERPAFVRKLGARDS